MNSAKIYIIFFLFVVFSIAFELAYLNKHKKNYDSTNAFLTISCLGDLSLSTEARFIRHRSFSDSFSVFSESPEIREYFPSTFVYAPSNIFSNTPAKVNIDNE